MLCEQYQSCSSSLCSFITSSCFFLLRSKYLLQHPEHPHPMLSQCDKPNITPVHNNRHTCGLHLLISTSVDAKGKVRGFTVALSRITQIQSVRKFFLDELFICHGRSQRYLSFPHIRSSLYNFRNYGIFSTQTYLNFGRNKL
jgi:hypothetical protein